MRNRLVHAYDAVRDDLVLAFVVRRLDLLVAFHQGHRTMGTDLDAAIASDLAFLQGRVLGILRFGSSTSPDQTPRDIDICLVAPGQDPADLLLEVFRRVDVRGRRYDVRVFEQLPIWLRHEVLRQHVVTWTSDLPAMSEYLYGHRKLCEDMVQRQRKAM